MLPSPPPFYNAIHPLLRGADLLVYSVPFSSHDSSPPARGRLTGLSAFESDCRFIPSCEGQTNISSIALLALSIHPLLRGADPSLIICAAVLYDSSPPARGRHSVFMRLSAALNTSLCNLHKCHFQLVTHHFLYI